MSKPGMTDEEIAALWQRVSPRRLWWGEPVEADMVKWAIRAAYALGRKAQRKRDAALIRCVGAAAIEGAEDE